MNAQADACRLAARSAADTGLLCCCLSPAGASTGCCCVPTMLTGASPPWGVMWGWSRMNAGKHIQPSRCAAAAGVAAALRPPCWCTCLHCSCAFQAARRQATSCVIRMDWAASLTSIPACPRFDSLEQPDLSQLPALSSRMFFQTHAMWWCRLALMLRRRAWPQQGCLRPAHWRLLQQQ